MLSFLRTGMPALALFLSFSLISLRLSAEGSRELMPDIDSRAALCTQGSSGFAGYASPAIDRLYIHIKDAANEVVYLNFSMGYGTGVSNILGEGDGAPFYFRIKDPSGNIVFGPQLIDNTNAIPSGSTGYNQVVAGPVALSAGGYSAHTFTPSAGNGDYYIEFNKNDPNNATSSQCSFDYWDITVANTASGAVKGRIWSYAWGFYSKDYTSGGYSGIFKGKLYSYSTDQIVQSIDFANSGFKGGSFRIGLSSTGPGNTDDYLLDRQSIYNVRTVGKDYKIFLNDPDITVYPSGSILNDNISFSATPFSCTSTSVSFNYNLIQGGIVEVLLDFNNNGVYDPGTRDRVLAQVLSAGSHSIVWDLKDGLGNTVNSTTDPTIKLITTYGKSVSHLTVADVEFFSGGFVPVIVRPTPPSPYTPKLYYDDEAMRTALAATASPNRQYPDTLLAFNNAAQPPVKELNGCTAPCHVWTNFGTASGGDLMNNNINGYGNGNSINTWWYSFVERDEYTLLLAACGPLPVTLLGWEVTPLQNHTAGLVWSTGSETNHDYFEIQRSLDLVSYESIATIRESTGSTVKKYAYTDKDNVLKGRSFAAYRLLQVDRNGRKTTSDLKVARFGKEYSPVIGISSNPVKDKMQVSFNSAERGLAVINLIDMSGRTLVSSQYNVNAGFNSLWMYNLESIIPGAYIVRLSVNGKLLGSERIIK